jgi:hypothetical protein
MVEVHDCLGHHHVSGLSCGDDLVILGWAEGQWLLT